MKFWLIGALMLAVAATTTPTSTEAKRLGSGKPAGMQRDMPARTAPDAPAGKPAQASPQQASPAANPGAGAAAATAPKRNWMGPIAGLAAGLGIAALLSHLGMGEAVANFLMMALLAGAAVFLVMFLLRRFGPGAKNRGPALASAAAGSTGRAGGAQVSWPTPSPVAAPMERSASGLDSLNSGPSASTTESGAANPAVSSLAPAATTVSRAFVPAAFDSENFTRTAKMIFIRLQAANDTADLDDLRRFTTPELFASIRLDIQDRGSKAQTTDVVRVEAEVLDVANDADRQIVSVRFHGEIVEEKGSSPVAFNEVWHLVKPHDDSQSWAIAGIEQLS